MEEYRSGFLIMIMMVLVLLVGGTLLHNWGQAALENEPMSLLKSFEFVTQTMTTVGYGQEAGWNHPLMYVLAVTIQLAGISIVFMSIPVVVTPWLENRLQTEPPKQYEGPEDHLVITNYSSSLDDLLDELDRREHPYVILEEDKETARDLFRDDYNVVYGNAREPEDLEAVDITGASSVILEGTDQRNASVSLVVRELCQNEEEESIEIMAIARKTDRAIQLEQAGVDEVIYPREIIGEALADKALTGSSSSMDFEMLPEFEIREYPLLQHHPLVNKRLSSTRLPERFGVNPIGVWRMGQFHSLSEGVYLQSNDVLVVAGVEESLDELDEFLGSRSQWQQTGTGQDVMIIGFGQEGQAANRDLKEHGIEPTVVNDINLPDVDIVGDAMNEETLREAGIDEVDVVIITISLDDESVMVALLVDRLNPDAEVLVQVRTSPTVESAYRSGACYVQSLDEITSRMLVSRVFDENFLDFDLNIEFIRTNAGELAGERLGDVDLIDEYGVTPVGLERNEDTLELHDDDFVFREDDEILFVGFGDDIEGLCKEFDLDRLRIEEGEKSEQPEMANA
jgi:Trk K+ transport system NAD-binding subunit